MDLDQPELENQTETSSVFDIEADEPDKETVDSFFDKLTGAYDKVAPVVDKVAPKHRGRKPGTTTKKTKDEAQLDQQDIAEMAAGAILLITGFFVSENYIELLPTTKELTAILLPWERIRSRHYGSIASKVSVDGQDVLLSLGAMFAYFDRLRDIGHERRDRKSDATTKNPGIGLRGQQLYNLGQTPFTDVANALPENPLATGQKSSGLGNHADRNPHAKTNGGAHAELFNDATNQLLMLDLQGRNQLGING
jgi:hypothetical protein